MRFFFIMCSLFLPIQHHQNTARNSAAHGGSVCTITVCIKNKKHLKNVGPIRYCEPPHAHSPDVASGTVARRLRIDVHDDNDNA